MGLLDFILAVAGLLLWLNWRSARLDLLAVTQPATLAGTLKRTEPRRLRTWQLASGTGVLFLLLLRTVLHVLIGAPIGWTPRLNLGLVVLVFRSDRIPSAALYSVLSFLQVLVIGYFWLVVLAWLNRRSPDTDPIQKLIRLHLGRLGRLPPAVQLLFPFVVAVLLWLGANPLLVHLGVVARPLSYWVMLEQAALVALGLVLTLKFLLPALLLVHIVTSYVYLGSNPLWDFISLTARNLLAPLQRLPLQFARVDFAPAVGLVLLLLLLHWLPNAVPWLLSQLLHREVGLWPR